MLKAWYNRISPLVAYVWVAATNAPVAIPLLRLVPPRLAVTTGVPVGDDKLAPLDRSLNMLECHSRGRVVIYMYM